MQDDDTNDDPGLWLLCVLIALVVTAIEVCWGLPR